MKRNHDIDHVYTGEEQPTPLTLNTVSVFVGSKRKKARVVTKSYGVPTTNFETDNLHPPPGSSVSFDNSPAAAKDSAGNNIDGNNNTDSNSNASVCHNTGNCNTDQEVQDPEKVYTFAHSSSAVLTGFFADFFAVCIFQD